MIDPAYLVMIFPNLRLTSSLIAVNYGLREAYSKTKTCFTCKTKVFPFDTMDWIGTARNQKARTVTPV